MKRTIFVLHPSVRARAYLQRACARGLVPRQVIRIGSDAADVASPAWTRPADGSFDPQESLRQTIARFRLDEVHVDDPDVNSASLRSAVRRADPDLVVFTGGGLLQAETLSAAPAWLHVHPGRLPDRRGSTCIHYGLLLDGVVEASAMIMRAGLDEGPVVCTRRFEPTSSWTAEGLDHVDDAWIRSSVLVDALAHWRDVVPRPQAGMPRTFFVIHPVLKHLALGLLEDGPSEARRVDHLEAISS